ncbi:hypothetical protein BO70DRAFT_115009 [Aspergillus heteromorphus CBS 117.55]|uniref:Uncharacterized protein n=1 Tax=Aspergillus heteromorphus CBS 117.55 TaxID=1448321 RepID=A0A317VMD5_9EURO|nr:uncharacterized protein BO70DRAFT_115009 [Aspergillus heteromorphus CBS 117.55]PWY73060.1 hypothetical protein BO70DRAFT_115009 [Aspergillus heteromorphus CBS 117.55]
MLRHILRRDVVFPTRAGAVQRLVVESDLRGMLQQLHREALRGLSRNMAVHEPGLYQHRSHMAGYNSARPSIEKPSTGHAPSWISVSRRATNPGLTAPRTIPQGLVPSISGHHLCTHRPEPECRRGSTDDTHVNSWAPACTAVAGQLDPSYPVMRI